MKMCAPKCSGTLLCSFAKSISGSLWVWYTFRALAYEPNGFVRQIGPGSWRFLEPWKERFRCRNSRSS